MPIKTPKYTHPFFRTWGMVWYPEKLAPVLLVRGASSPGNAYRRFYATHRDLEKDVHVFSMNNRVGA